MNRAGFKDSILWNNVGEVAVVTGNKAVPVYHSALLRAVTVRRRFPSLMILIAPKLNLD